MSVKTQFIDNLFTLITARVPLVVTKTREPYKACEAVDDVVQCYNKRLREMNPDQNLYDGMAGGRWNIITGWTVRMPEEYPNDVEDMVNESEFYSNGTIDLVGALAQVMGIEPIKTDGNFKNRAGEASNLAPDGIYVMNWPHFAFDSPLVKGYLLDITDRFCYEHKTLVLVVPEICDIPQELQDFVVFLDYGVPSDEERHEVIVKLIEACKIDPESLSEEDHNQISSAGAGMTGFEFEGGIARSVKTLTKLNQPVTGENIAQMILENKTEMVKRSEVLEIMPKGKMSDIGGLDNLKEWVAKRKHCFTEQAKEFGVDLPKGIALFGPPGTGKSASAKAIGHELGLPVIRFDVSRVFNSLVGSSEARVRQALNLIEAMAPCVAFLDEVDKAFDNNRGGGDGGVGQRVLGSILTFLQESKKPVFWVMTGNRVDGLPPELLRKGRLDEVFSVNVPYDYEREEIIKIHLRLRKQDPNKIQDIGVAVAQSDGYVAAELEAAVKEALVEAFISKQPVTGQLIAEQLMHMKKLSEAFAKEFQSMAGWAADNARPASKDPGGITFKKLATTSTGSTVRRQKQRSVDL